MDRAWWRIILATVAILTVWFIIMSVRWNQTHGCVRSHVVHVEETTNFWPDGDGNLWPRTDPAYDYNQCDEWREKK